MGGRAGAKVGMVAVNGFVLQMRNLGPGRLAALAGVGIAMLGMIVFMTTRLSSTPMELLYGDLQPADANAIIRQLEDQRISYQLRANGTEIMVPADQVLRLRLQMAEQVNAGGASLGYEVFDTMDSLGATNFMQNVNLVRALEGELARTIRSIAGIAAVRVHLVMPKREMFTRDVQEPSASIYIRMERGRLGREQVQAIQHLVAAAVPKLEPNRVSIVDERGSLLSQGLDRSQLAIQTQEELRLQEEARLARAVEELLERTLGPGKVRAEVRALMDFDRVVTQEEIYDPEGQVARSTVTREENIESSEADPDTVSVAQNLPDAQMNVSGPRASNRENRLEETTNFEVSRRTINQIREGGVLQRLSVAVLVDGTYTTGANGERVYQARTDQQMDQIAALVRSAIGFDANRGDTVELVNMQFMSFDDFQVEEPWMFMGFTKDEILRIAEGLGVAIVAVLIILLVVRPLVTRAFEAQAVTPDGQLLGADGGPPQLMGPGGSVPAPIPEEEDLSDELIDIDKVEGRVKASSLRKIGEIVDKHPEEALSIIRNWLYQET